ncbi:hypothetical protein JCM6882_006767 [Rhodosporidiobolus microsporus]
MPFLSSLAVYMHPHPSFDVPRTSRKRTSSALDEPYRPRPRAAPIGDVAFFYAATPRLVPSDKVTAPSLEHQQVLPPSPVPCTSLDYYLPHWSPTTPSFSTSDGRSRLRTSFSTSPSPPTTPETSVASAFSSPLLHCSSKGNFDPRSFSDSSVPHPCSTIASTPPRADVGAVSPRSSLDPVENVPAQPTKKQQLPRSSSFPRVQRLLSREKARQQKKRPTTAYECRAEEFEELLRQASYF